MNQHALDRLKEAESLLAFHEGSAAPEFQGAHPTVRINGEDFATILNCVRIAVTAAAGSVSNG